MGNSLIRLWVKICLFLVSYLPLFIMMIILNYDNPFILYSVSAIVAVSFVGLMITFYVLNRISGEYKQAKDITPASKVNFQYFIAYVIPFIAIDMDSTRQLVAYGVLFVFIGILYIKTELLYVNPTLTMLGYHLFKVTTDNESIMLISRNNHKKVLNDPIVSISQDLYFERKKRINSTDI